MRRRLPALLVGLAGCAVLAFHVDVWRAEEGLRVRNARRLWEDVSLAGSRYGRRGGPVGAEPTGIGEGAGFAVRRAYQRRLAEAADADGIEPWQFWRTVRVKPALTRAALVPRTSDDVGRAALLYYGFRACGGIAPLLGLWIGALACMPVLVWTAWELGAAGRLPAAAVFLSLLACSPFVVEVLTLPYSAVGFALLALLGLVPMATYAFLGRGASKGGFVARVIVAGALLALCILCRSGAVVSLPGYLLATAVAARRVFPPDLSAPGWRRRAPAFAGFAFGAAALVAPYASVRSEHHHYAWTGIWEGLGDFDRTKGHAWSDPEARRALRREGIAIPRGAGLEFELDGNAAVLRRLVLDHVRESPGWFAGILLKRAVAAVTQARLWPRASRDGVSFAHSTTSNEGAMDIYYRLATTADVFGLGPLSAELPIVLLPLPAVGLAALWLRRRRDRGTTGALTLLVCVAAVALVHPVLITTASALETEFFVVVDMLGAALLVGELARPRSVGAEVVEPEGAAGARDD